jgi:serine/threonine protein phosphatase PrpC
MVAITIGVVSMAALLTMLLLLRLGLHDMEGRDLPEKSPDGLDNAGASPQGRVLAPRSVPCLPRREGAATEASGGARGSGEPTLTPVSNVGPSAPTLDGALLIPEAAGLTHAGHKRRADPNEDSLLMRLGTYQVNGSARQCGLFVVADGMGGRAYGPEASGLTTSLIADYVVPRLATDWSVGSTAFTRVLKEAVANANVGLLGENRVRHIAMGATVTVALLVGDTAYVANVGNGRLYVYNPRYGLRQVTTDHLIVSALAAVGLLPPEALYTHPRRNQLYRSLGARCDCQVDTFQVPLRPEDRLLLCTDGLWGMVRDAQLEAVLCTSSDARVATDRLVRAANDNGGHDNISVIVVRMLDQHALRDAHRGAWEVKELHSPRLPHGHSASALRWSNPPSAR